MANLLKTLIPLLSSVAFLLTTSNTARSQTTSFAYDFNGQKPTDLRHLTYQGDAHFPSETTHLRLTKTDDSGNPLGYSAGRVVYATPIQFWQTGAQADFYTTIKFRISTVDSNPGDGFVFFIAPVGTAIPAGHSGGNFGVFDSSSDRNPSIFAVEFDTFVNADVDPNYRHIGIDIEYLKSVVTKEMGDAVLDEEVTAVIQYVGTQKRIRVVMTTSSSSYVVSYKYDLSTVLDQQVQVGLAASTGASVAVHDVVSWYFTATLVHRNAAMAKEDIKIQQYV